jgi:hypothetical protein
VTGINLDIPVVFVLSVAMLYVLLHFGHGRFIASCFAASTFGAVFTAGVTLSVGRIVPILMVPMALRKGNAGLLMYAPFVVYAVAVTLWSSLFWKIPDEVAFAYGEGRVYVQLFNFLILVLATRALTLALQEQNAVPFLWRAFAIAVLVHGLASLYQALAGTTGWPLIGISRPFGASGNIDGLDVAAFATKAGDLILRPGGLAGEPKTAAIIFGIYIAAYACGGWRIEVKRWARSLAFATLIVSFGGFTLAFSTSALIGLPLALIATSILLRGSGAIRAPVIWAVGLLCAILVFGALFDIGSTDLFELVQLRTTDRLIDSELDAPVEASLAAMNDNLAIALFGDGLGGSSFITMAFLNQAFELSYAPNVGIVLFLVEIGVFGTLLLLGPLCWTIALAAFRVRHNKSPSAEVLLAASIGATILSLTSSGTALGIPFAVASAAIAGQISKFGGRVTSMEVSQA